MKRIIAPSILSADFSNLSSAVSLINKTRAEWIHLDVMDGHFVPNITFGPKVVADLRRHTNKILDTHLMVSDPDFLIPLMKDAGSDALTIHAESAIHLHRSLEKIKELKMACGVSIVPSTPVALIQEILPMVDIVLIMTVNPGFGGQSLIPGCKEKINRLAELRIEHDYVFRISVDGGVNLNTAPELWRRGADVLVSGSSFFAADNAVSFTDDLLNC